MRQVDGAMPPSRATRSWKYCDSSTNICDVGSSNGTPPSVSIKPGSNHKALAPALYKPVVLNSSTAMALRHGALKLDKSFGSPTCPWRISSADDLMLTQKQNIILKKHQTTIMKICSCT
jgi:hypothetical protein